MSDKVYLSLTREQAINIAALLNDGCSISAVSGLKLAGLSARLSEEFGDHKFVHNVETFHVPSGLGYEVIPVENREDIFIDVT